jgi:RNA polymerase sigma factor (TIGR02999 family)
MSANGAQPAITQLLRGARDGDGSSVERLLLIVYEELRGIAKSYIRRERADHTLEPTALVHEAFIRLLDQAGGVDWNDRAHFRGVAARAMRQILVDHARRKGAAKRGGGAQALSLTQIEGGSGVGQLDVLILSEMLERLSMLDEQMGRIVEMRFFGGMDNEESAQVLGVTSRTVRNKLKIAQAWLSRELERERAS